MTKIKKIVKNAGITQEILISRLSLSKPTFYSYVKLFENNAELPRERYQIIFHRLFDDENISAEEFSEKLEWAESMLQRDSRFGIEELRPEDADYAYQTLNLITEDIKKTDREKSIYVLINYLLTGYRKNDVFKYLARYFSFLNGALDLSEMKEDDKIYMASFYNCFKQLVDRSVQFDPKEFKLFLQRCNELKKNREERTQRAKEQITEAVLAVREENEKLGIDLDDNDLIKAIKEKI